MQGCRRQLAGPVLLAALGLGSTAWAADGDALAIVNGRPLSRPQVVDALIEAHGLQMMQQLIVLELVKEEARRAKITVTAGDIDREYQRALEKIAPAQDAGGKPLTADEKEQTLDRLLQQNCLSRLEFRIGMERNAYLRKLVAGEVNITDGTLREEFARQNGEKVQVRVILVEQNDKNRLNEVLNLLAKGTDFAEVAKRASADTSILGGKETLEFTFDDPEVAPVLREAAFSLKPNEHVGPISLGRWLFFLRLEKRIPPTGLKFEDVRDQVRTQLEERVFPRLMNEKIMGLYQKADIRVLDATLKPQFEKLREQQRANPGLMQP